MIITQKVSFSLQYLVPAILLGYSIFFYLTNLQLTFFYQNLLLSYNAINATFWVIFQHSVLGKCWTYLLAGYINYSTTLMIFPALTSTVESMSNTQWSKKFFTPVAVVLLFNVCDLIGRILSTVIAWPKRTPIGKYGFLFICMLRIGLIPLFMVCNAKPNSRTLPLILGYEKSEHWNAALQNLFGRLE